MSLWGICQNKSFTIYIFHKYKEDLFLMTDLWTLPNNTFKCYEVRVLTQCFCKSTLFLKGPPPQQNTLTAWSQEAHTQRCVNHRDNELTLTWRHIAAVVFILKHDIWPYHIEEDGQFCNLVVPSAFSVLHRKFAFISWMPQKISNNDVPSWRVHVCHLAVSFGGWPFCCFWDLQSEMVEI